MNVAKLAVYNKTKTTNKEMPNAVPQTIPKAPQIKPDTIRLNF